MDATGSLRRVAEPVDLARDNQIAGAAPHLHSLVLHDCSLSSLSGLPQLPRLVELCLSSNNLVELGAPSTWACISSTLRRLDLSSNRLRGAIFENWAARLPQLVHLALPYNAVDSLYGLAAVCPQLTELDASYNRLDKEGSPEDSLRCLQRLPSLTNLTLSLPSAHPTLAVAFLPGLRFYDGREASVFLGDDDDEDDEEESGLLPLRVRELLKGVNSGGGVGSTQGAVSSPHQASSSRRDAPEAIGPQITAAQPPSSSGPPEIALPPRSAAATKDTSRGDEGAAAAASTTPAATAGPSSTPRFDRLRAAAEAKAQAERQASAEAKAAADEQRIAELEQRLEELASRTAPFGQPPPLQTTSNYQNQQHNHQQLQPQQHPDSSKWVRRPLLVPAQRPLPGPESPSAGPHTRDSDDDNDGGGGGYGFGSAWGRNNRDIDNDDYSDDGNGRGGMEAMGKELPVGLRSWPDSPDNDAFSLAESSESFSVDYAGRSSTHATAAARSEGFNRRLTQLRGSGQQHSPRQDRSQHANHHHHPSHSKPSSSRHTTSSRASEFHAPSSALSGRSGSDRRRPRVTLASEASVSTTPAPTAQGGTVQLITRRRYDERVVTTPAAPPLPVATGASTNGGKHSHCPEKQTSRHQSSTVPRRPSTSARGAAPSLTSPSQGQGRSSASSTGKREAESHGQLNAPPPPPPLTPPSPTRHGGSFAAVDVGGGDAGGGPRPVAVQSPPPSPSPSLRQQPSPSLHQGLEQQQLEEPQEQGNQQEHQALRRLCACMNAEVRRASTQAFGHWRWTTARRAASAAAKQANERLALAVEEASTARAAVAEAQRAATAAETQASQSAAHAESATARANAAEAKAAAAESQLKAREEQAAAAALAEAAAASERAAQYEAALTALKLELAAAQQRAMEAQRVASAQQAAAAAAQSETAKAREANLVLRAEQAETALAAEVAQHRTAKEAHASEIQALQSQFATLERARNDATHAAQRDQATAIEHAVADAVEAANQRFEAQAERAAGRAAQKVAELQRAFGQAAAQAADAKAAAAHAQQQEQALRATVAELSALARDQREALAAAKQRSAALESRLEEVQEQHQRVVQQQLPKLEQQHAQEERTRRALEQRCADAEARAAAQERAALDSNRAQEAASQRCKELTNEVAVKSAMVSDATAAAEPLRRRAAHLEERLRRLEAHVAELDDERSSAVADAEDLAQQLDASREIEDHLRSIVRELRTGSSDRSDRSSSGDGQRGHASAFEVGDNPGASSSAGPRGAVSTREASKSSDIDRLAAETEELKVALREKDQALQFVESELLSMKTLFDGREKALRESTAAELANATRHHAEIVASHEAAQTALTTQVRDLETRLRSLSADLATAAAARDSAQALASTHERARAEEAAARAAAVAEARKFQSALTAVNSALFAVQASGAPPPVAPP